MSDTDIARQLRNAVTASGGVDMNGPSLLLEAAAEIEALKHDIERYVALSTDLSDQIERLRAGRAAVWAECRETCARVADEYIPARSPTNDYDSGIMYGAEQIADRIRALEVPNE